MFLEVIEQYCAKYSNLNKNIDSMRHITTCSTIPRVSYFPNYTTLTPSEIFSGCHVSLLSCYSMLCRSILTQIYYPNQKRWPHVPHILMCHVTPYPHVPRYPMCRITSRDVLPHVLYCPYAILPRIVLPHV